MTSARGSWEAVNLLPVPLHAEEKQSLLFSLCNLAVGEGSAGQKRRLMLAIWERRKLT